MQLNTHTWGDGDRTALLVHGLMSDHRTWRRVGPALAGLGYRVIAVDLRGHGASGRGAYAPELFADDLVETLPAGADLALGHSLGGLSLSLAAARLRPARAVYSDPAWTVPEPLRGLGPELSAQFKRAGRKQVEALNPRWEAADVDVELATLALWDESTALGLGGTALAGGGLMPDTPAVPSMVQLADPSFLVSPEQAAALASRGFEVRTVPGAGHTIHRDDFDGFMASLSGWL
ncbi:alpha/beta hydrolase [Streptomyces bambusae]|uniref:alpha/beta fold hydrolase n=1 Tax=Streptomyces bambusae TaxID=1550616 RepID=UPI001CFE9CB1|nr:alpha/beta hydrolase [Streptomyces bambusae]MCB5164309.1 alpha/beta hydrolase [Streptomyces bambusae]